MRVQDATPDEDTMKRRKNEPWTGLDGSVQREEDPARYDLPNEVEDESGSVGEDEELTRRKALRNMMDVFLFAAPPWVWSALWKDEPGGVLRVARHSLKYRLSQNSASARNEAARVVEKFGRWRTEMFRAFPECPKAVDEYLRRGNEDFIGMLGVGQMVHFHVERPERTGSRRTASRSFRISAEQCKVLWDLAGKNAFPRFRYRPGEFANQAMKILKIWGEPPHAILCMAYTHIRGTIDNSVAVVLVRPAGQKRWGILRLYHLDASPGSLAWGLGNENLNRLESQLPSVTLLKSVNMQDVIDLVEAHRRLIDKGGFGRGRSRRLNSRESFVRGVCGLDSREIPIDLAVRWIDGCMSRTDPPPLKSFF
jgi:hypothetical protein